MVMKEGKLFEGTRNTMKFMKESMPASFNPKIYVEKC
jgi:hypothetical protein